MENLTLYKRQKGTGHAARRERRQGKIPGIMYGKNINSMLFEIGEMELSKEVAKNGEHCILNVELEGQTHKTLIKELQRDPVIHKILHIDLEEIAEDETIQAEIPILFTGEDLITKRGAAVQKERTNVKIECKAEKLPKHIDVNVSRLEVGNAIRIGDIELARDIAIIDDLNAIIASITINNKPSELAVETK